MGDPPSQSQTVTIPEGVTRYEVPPIELASTVIVGGRVVDSANRPVAKARVLGVRQGGMRKPFAGPDVVTDAAGEFRLPTNPTTRSRAAPTPGSRSGWPTEPSMRPPSRRASWEP